MKLRFPGDIASLLLLLAAGAYAGDDVRCGNSIVNSDMSVQELLHKCGEPTSKQVREEDVRAANAGGGTRRVGTTYTEIWTYDRGSNAFGLVVTIVDGNIKSIVTQP